MKKGIQFVFVVLAASLFISQPVKADRPESCTYLEWDLLRQTNDKRISEGISPIRHLMHYRMQSTREQMNCLIRTLIQDLMVEAVLRL